MIKSEIKKKKIYIGPVRNCPVCNIKCLMLEGCTAEGFELLLSFQGSREQEKAGRMKGGKPEGGGAILKKHQDYWKFPLSSGKTVVEVELRGEINKVVERKLKKRKILCYPPFFFTTVSPSVSYT